MIYSNFDQLVEKVRNESARRKVVAVVAAADAHTLEAVVHATRNGILSSLLIGPAMEIAGLLRELGEVPAEYRIVDAATPPEAAVRAAEFVRTGEADFVMKGRVQTGDLLHAMLDTKSGMRTGRLLSHFALAQVPAYHKLLGITDVAINIAPTLEQKKEIVENAVTAMKAMGFDAPKIALLSASETVNPRMPESAEAAELTRMNREGWLTDCAMAGPISFDLAFSHESAEIKGYESPVPGDVDLLVVPHITVGNVLLKALRYTANAASAGLVVGGRAPIVLTSRAVSAQDKYLPLVLAASMEAGEQP